MDSNEFNRHGSSDWATARDVKRAGYCTASLNAIHLGFFKPSWNWRLNWNGDAGILICAGPRSGKYTGIGGYNALPGFSQRTQVIHDSKGEWWETALNQTLDGRRCAIWSPFERPGVPRHRINPVGHIKAGSEKMVAFIKVLMESLVPESGGGNSRFFELSAREIGEAIAIPVTERDGQLTFPALKYAIDLMLQDTAEAHDFEWLMKSSRWSQVQSVQEFIRQGKKSSSNTFFSVMAELKNALACLSEPRLLESVSPPFDIDIEDIARKGKWNLYLMPHSDFISIWGPVLRTFFTTMKALKEEYPDARDQDWWVDEAHLLAPFPMLARMLNFGAGMGVRPIIMVQSFEQLDDIVPNGSTIIPAGCGVQIYFGIREIESAKTNSEMLGKQTLRYNDGLAQSEARLKRKAIIEGIFSGADPVALGRDYRHQTNASQHRSEMERWLMTASEITRMPAGHAIMFGDHLPHPARIYIPPYYEQRQLAGRFYPHNKYSADMSKVRVKTRLGHTWLDVKTGPVPHEFAQFPQYADGHWTYIES